jgi:hypothetical protein
MFTWPANVNAHAVGRNPANDRRGGIRPSPDVEDIVRCDVDNRIGRMRRCRRQTVGMAGRGVLSLSMTTTEDNAENQEDPKELP